MKGQCDLAIVGATGLVGESLIELLQESRTFPLGRLHLLAGPDRAGTRIEFRGGYLAVQELAGFDFSTVPLAIFATGSHVSAEFAPRAAAAGCVVIDTSACFRQDPQVPLVVAELNSGALAGHRRLFATPASVVTEALVALHPIVAAAGLERLEVTVLEPVSASGREAVEELAGQSAALLNGQPIETRVYPRQIAFNCLVSIDERDQSGYTKYEMQLRNEIRRVLGVAELPVQFTRVRVPVFHGETVALRVTTRKPLAAADARRLLEAAPGLQVPDEGVTPVEAVGQDDIYVNPPVADPDTPRTLFLWATADNIRRGMAGNALRLAELLVKEYL